LSTLFSSLSATVWTKVAVVIAKVADAMGRDLPTGDVSGYSGPNVGYHERRTYGGGIFNDAQVTINNSSWIEEMDGSD